MATQANNSFTFIGRITKDPEFNTTQNGNHNLKFTIAIDQPPKRNQDGSIQKDANGYTVRDSDFPRVILWGSRAQSLVNTLCKGTLVAVTGSVRTRMIPRTDSKGSEFYIDFNVAGLEILGGNTKQSRGDTPNVPQGTQPPGQYPQQPQGQYPQGAPAGAPAGAPPAPGQYPQTPQGQYPQGAPPPQSPQGGQYPQRPPSQPPADSEF